MEFLFAYIQDSEGFQTFNLTVMSKELQKNAPSNAVYGLGIIGAAVFYIGKAATFWAGVVGILKAMVWPAFLVYEALKHFTV
jgi:hypothetical protein